MTCYLGGVQFDNVTMNEAVSTIIRMAQKAEKHYLICTANLDHLATMQVDEEFQRIYRQADFVVADGMPIVWLSHLAGTPLKERVAGSDLFWELGRASGLTGVRLFFLGGQPSNAQKSAERLREAYPDVQVCGTYCPPYGTLDDEDENRRIHEAINAAQPDILLVGLGSPKQEKWIAANRDKLDVPVWIGVGAAFDMAAGMVQRAPRWLQNTGFEWLYRLLQEPRRLAKRYLLRDIPYFLTLTLVTLRLRMRARRTRRDSAGTVVP